MNTKVNYLSAMDFITGATGILGRELLAQLLESGREVRALRRENSSVEDVEKMLEERGLSDKINSDKPSLFWVLGDINDSESMEKAVKGCERVFHIAALVSFHPSDDKELMYINGEGTATVVNAMLHEGVKDLIYVSSVAALGYREGVATTEETPFEEGPGVTGYGKSKFRAELEMWRGQEEGLNVVAVNPTIIIGPGDYHRSSAELFSQIYDGLPFYPTGANGYVSSNDVARACILLADLGIRGERFLLCAENRDYLDIMSSIASSLGVKSPTIAIKPWMSSLIWRGYWVLEKLTGKRALATKSSLEMASINMIFDGSKLASILLEKEIKWTYEPVDEAIARTAKAYISSTSI